MHAVFAVKTRRSLTLASSCVLATLATFAVTAVVHAQQNGTGGVAAGDPSLAQMAMPDTTAPHVKIFARFSKCAVRKLRIKVAATDASGVASVDYSIDGEKIVGTLVAPYAVTLNLRSLEAGRHRLAVRVLDNAGNLAVVNRSFKRCERRAAVQRRSKPKLAG